MLDEQYVDRLEWLYKTAPLDALANFPAVIAVLRSRDRQLLDQNVELQDLREVVQALVLVDYGGYPMLGSEYKAYWEWLTKKLVFHIREVSKGSNRVTPRDFHLEILPKFPKVAGQIITNIFFTITEIEVKRYVYHRLKAEYLNYDDKDGEDKKETKEGNTDQPNLFSDGR